MVVDLPRKFVKDTLGLLDGNLVFGVENRDPRREEQESEASEKTIIVVDTTCEESHTHCVAVKLLCSALAACPLSGRKAPLCLLDSTSSGFTRCPGPDPDLWTPVTVSRWFHRFFMWTPVTVSRWFHRFFMTPQCSPACVLWPMPECRNNLEEGV